MPLSRPKEQLARLKQKLRSKWRKKRDRQAEFHSHELDTPANTEIRDHTSEPPPEYTDGTFTDPRVQAQGRGWDGRFGIDPSHRPVREFGADPHSATLQQETDNYERAEGVLYTEPIIQQVDAALVTGTSKHEIKTPSSKVVAHRPWSRPRPRAKTARKVQKPPILLLPEEILSEILELAILRRSEDYDPRAPSPFDFYYDSAAVLSVGLACRVFFRHVGAFSYYNVKIQTKGDKYTINRFNGLWKLHRNMRDNHRLGKQCRNVIVAIKDEHEHLHMEAFDRLGDTLQFFFRVTNFRLHGGFSHSLRSRTWRVMGEAWAKMPNLKHLELIRHQERIDYKDVLEKLTSLPLKKLVIGGTSSSYQTSHLTNISEYRRNAAFTDLSISDDGTGLNSIPDMIAWPKELERIHLGKRPGASRSPVILDMSRLHAALRMHRSTLKSLSIEQWDRIPGSRDTVDFSMFHEIESMAISSWHVLRYALHPEELPPKLQSLTLDYSDNTDGSCFAVFTQHHKKFVENLLEKLLARESPLQKVYVKLALPEKLTRAGLADGMDITFPWSHLDSLKLEFEPKGLGFEYSEQPMTRGQWNRWVLGTQVHDPSGWS